MTAAGKMIYLFAQSIVPTVPAGWLTFAEGAVYKATRRRPCVCSAFRSPTTSNWPARS